jgi:hypothetical protein
VDKTKVMIFKNEGKMKNNVIFFFFFFCNGRALQIVDEFNYLGMLFSYNEKFNITQKHIADKRIKGFFLSNKQ